VSSVGTKSFFDYIDVERDAESAGIRRSAYLAKPASQQSGRMP